MVVCLAVALAAALSQASTSSTRAHAPVAHAAAPRHGCRDPFSGKRVPGNPLGLKTAPGADPLNGAQLMVSGPFSNYASHVIAQLLGLGNEFGPHKLIKPTTSWAEFEQNLESGPLHARLMSEPATVQKQIDALALLAGQETPERVTAGSAGGTPRGIHNQTLKDFCAIHSSDPHTIPVIVTYFLHPELGGCSTTAQINADMPKFHRQIKAMTSAIARRPALMLLEIDALGSSSCMYRHGSLPAWLKALNYEMTQFEKLPHTAVYIEGGYSDSNSVRYTVRAMKQLQMNKIQGFFTNDTHMQWTSHEVAWATKIAKQVHTHFIVNTSDNGQGPKLNPHPSKQGIEDTCNPPGRGIGIPPTTATGRPLVDAYLWEHPPGISAGPSCGVSFGGTKAPPNGAFWPAKAQAEVGLANARFSPGQNIPYSAPTLETTPPTIPPLPPAPGA